MEDHCDLAEAADDVLWSRLGQVKGLDRADVLIELANRAQARGEHSRGVALLEEAAGEAEDTGDARLAAYARYLEGGQRFTLGDYLDSAAAYLKAVDLSRSVGRQGDQARALWGRADAFCAAGQFEEAAAAALDCRALAQVEDLAELGGDASYIIARAYYYLDRDNDALGACQQGRDLYRSVQAVEKLARLDDFAVTVHLYLGNLDDALELARNGYVLAMTTPSPTDDGYATRRLAEVHRRRGDLAAALARADEAREMYRTNEVMVGVARCDVIRAGVMWEEDKPQQALEVYTEARVLFDSVGADGEAQSCDINRAMLLHGLGDFREAAAVNRRLVEALGADTEGPSAGLPWAVLRLADNHLAAGDAEGALDVLEHWAHLWEPTDDDQPSRRWAYETWARALARVGRAEDAAGLAEAALALTDEEQINYLTADMYEVRARWMLECGDAQGRQELALAIAIHLAFGSSERARELSEDFMPAVRDRHGARPGHARETKDAGLGAA